MECVWCIKQLLHFFCFDLWHNFYYFSVSISFENALDVIASSHKNMRHSTEADWSTTPTWAFQRGEPKLDSLNVRRYVAQNLTFSAQNCLFIAPMNEFFSKLLIFSLKSLVFSQKFEFIKIFTWKRKFLLKIINFLHKIKKCLLKVTNFYSTHKYLLKNYEFERKNMTGSLDICPKLLIWQVRHWPSWRWCMWSRCV